MAGSFLELLRRSLCEEVGLSVESREAVVLAVEGFLAHLVRYCRTTVTRTLVGFNKSIQGVMIHLVVFTIYTGLPSITEEPSAKDIERLDIFWAEAKANMMLGTHWNVGVTVHLSVDPGLNDDWWERFFLHVAGEDRSVDYVGEADNLVA